MYGVWMLNDAEINTWVKVIVEQDEVWGLLLTLFKSHPFEALHLLQNVIW